MANKKTYKGRLDKFYWLAKQQGFNSRAAFKLIQMNKKFKFLEKKKCLVDLCASPGGWTQVALRYMPIESLVIAVDLIKMNPIDGCQIILGDITTKKCEMAVRKYLANCRVEIVLNDGAPNVGSSWSKDAYKQCELGLYALKLGIKIMKKGSLFITKVFHSQDYNAFLWICEQFFQKVVAFKPIASRMSSAETYFICQNFLAPTKIDSRLLDPSFVFNDIENKITIDIFNRKCNKKKNKGYETGLRVFHKECPILDFIKSERPIEMLGKYNKFIFSKTEKDFEDDDEIKQFYMQEGF